MSEQENKAAEQQAKNAVFAAKSAVEAAQNPGVPTVTRQAVAESEFGFTIPVDVVPLPSKGAVYPAEHPLHNRDRVEYRAMTAREEDILTSPALVKKGTVVNELIKSCLMNKDIDVNSLLSGDKNALLLAIRASGYGRMYEPQVNCPACDHRSKMSVDLAELEVKPLKLQPMEPGVNKFLYKIPNNSTEIAFKFLTGAEEEAILKQMNTRKKKGFEVSNLVTTQLQHQIVAVNGDPSTNKIAKLIRVLPAMFSKDLRAYIDDHEPGINMKTLFECPNCDHHEEVALPMDASFFWPNAKR